MSNTTNGLIPTIITVEWKQVWDDWNLRGFIILSLSLQTYLIFFAPLRKRTRRSFITMPLWSAYLLADWAANFAVGLISSNQGETTETNQNSVPNNKGGLIAFWAPFLLVHLGGPDTITAFALEDNELWIRHLLGLIFQCLAAVYVFLQSLPTDELWIPTLLMFMTGIIKYAERTRSLYLASFDSFRDSTLKEPDPGPNYAKLMGEYTSKKQAHLPTRIEMIAEPDRVIKTANKAVSRPLEPLEVVQYAYRYFENFKGLMVNLIFSFRERDQSREFFLKRNAKDAFDVVEVELNFFYEVLYTKLNVVYSKVGYICRPFSVGAVIASLVLFHSFEKHGFEDFDVALTYTLLIGALALDGVGLFMLVFSDFTFVKLDPSPRETEEDNKRTLLTRILTKLLEFKTHRWFQDTYLWRPMGVFARRWCESVGTYSLLHYCLNRRSKITETLYSYLGILAFIDETVYARHKPFPVELKTYIFKELKTKSKMADDLETSREICSARGDWVLRIESCSTLLPYIIDVDYDESILLWHVATELLYNSDLESMSEEERKRIVDDKDKKITENERKKMSRAELKKLKNEEFRKFSKLISDYMVYLLVMKPMMMSSVGGIGQIRFGDTCAEAKKFLDRDNPEKDKGVFGRLKNFLFSEKEEKKKKETKHEENKKINGTAKLIKACKDIHDVNTEVKPITVKGDRSKSVLFDGCLLAKELEKLGTGKSKVEKDKWEILSKVWIELLCYAASHIQATAHVQQVSRGGELITVVWLLMAHLGLGAQFQINEGHARAKLIVGK